MNRLIVLVLVVTLSTSGLLTSCAVVQVEGSGNLINKTFDFSNFTSVKAESGIDVELGQSSTFNVEVTADDKGIRQDMPAWCESTGHEFLGAEEKSDEIKVYVKKSHQ